MVSAILTMGTMDLISRIEGGWMRVINIYQGCGLVDSSVESGEAKGKICFLKF